MTDSSLTDSLSSSFQTIKPYLFIQSGLLVAFFLIGFFLPVPGKKEMLKEIMQGLSPIQELSPLWLFLFILANNATGTPRSVVGSCR